MPDGTLHPHGRTSCVHPSREGECVVRYFWTQRAPAGPRVHDTRLARSTPALLPCLRIPQHCRACPIPTSKRGELPTIPGSSGTVLIPAARKCPCRPTSANLLTDSPTEFSDQIYHDARRRRATASLNRRDKLVVVLDIRPNSHAHGELIWTHHHWTGKHALAQVQQQS